MVNNGTTRIEIYDALPIGYQGTEAAASEVTNETSPRIFEPNGLSTHLAWCSAFGATNGVAPRLIPGLDQPEFAVASDGIRTLGIVRCQ